MHFLEWLILNWNEILLKYFPQDLIDNMSALVQIMTYEWTGIIWSKDPLSNDNPFQWRIYVSPSLNELKMEHDGIKSWFYNIIWNRSDLLSLFVYMIPYSFSLNIAKCMQHGWKNGTTEIKFKLTKQYLPLTGHYLLSVSMSILENTHVPLQGSAVSMGKCKTVVSPVHMHWRYHSLALTHWYIVHLSKIMSLSAALRWPPVIVMMHNAW